MKKCYSCNAVIDDDAKYCDECGTAQFKRCVTCGALNRLDAKFCKDCGTNFADEKKPTYIFFDTETSGLPLKYNTPSSDVDNWPRLVQLSWITTDENGSIIKKRDYIIKPVGFSIPASAAKVHGITTEWAYINGVPLKTATDEFISDFESAKFVVGHNITFDKKIVGAELIRMGRKDIMDSKTSYCTMLSSVDYCKLPGSSCGKYKYPKLQELHYELFGYEFENAHNSLADVEATYNCFWELKKRGFIKDKGIKLTKNVLSGFSPVGIAVRDNGRIRLAVFDNDKNPVYLINGMVPYIEAKPGDFISLDSISLYEKQSEEGPYIVAEQEEDIKAEEVEKIEEDEEETDDSGYVPLWMGNQQEDSASDKTNNIESEDLPF